MKAIACPGDTLLFGIVLNGQKGDALEVVCILSVIRYGFVVPFGL